MRRFYTFALVLVAISALSLSSVNLESAFAKKAKPIPSPKPAWPPPGFDGHDGVYAKVPTRKELIGAATARASLRTQIALCKESQLACASVTVASERGCAWWEVNSAVRKLSAESNKKEKIGSLVTYARGTQPRIFATIMLVSQESADTSVSIGNIKVVCHPASDARPKLGNIYNPIVVEAS